jgi:hypothetical protein
VLVGLQRKPLRCRLPLGTTTIFGQVAGAGGANAGEHSIKVNARKGFALINIGASLSCLTVVEVRRDQSRGSLPLAIQEMKG